MVHQLAIPLSGAARTEEVRFGPAGYTSSMRTFSDRERRLIQKLKNLPPQTILKIAEACPLHSVCNPLPLFRVYKIDDASFEAEWNSHHKKGPKQIFRFEEAVQDPA